MSSMAWYWIALIIVGVMNTLIIIAAVVMLVAAVYFGKWENNPFWRLEQRLRKGWDREEK